MPPTGFFRSKNKYILFIALPLLLCAGTRSNTLPLPDSAKSIIPKIAEQCEACLKQGLSPTGTGEIGFGKRFFSNFFLGNPEVGILMSYVMDGKEYKTIIRENPLEAAKDSLRAAFEKTKLILIEKDGMRVQVLDKPVQVRVVLTPKLHQCLYRSAKPLCCCCTQSCEKECCEKELGSTCVLVQWQDPLDPAKRLEYAYYPYPGYSRVYDLDTKGKKTDLRWCLDSQGPGFLR